MLFTSAIKSPLRLAAFVATSLLAGCVTGGGGEYRDRREHRSEYEQNRHAVTIQISNASYGAGRRCDATHVLRRACNGQRSCSVDVSNKLCGDPESGRRKELRVEYSCRGNGGQSRHGSAREGRDLRISCY